MRSSLVFVTLLVAQACSTGPVTRVPDEGVLQKIADHMYPRDIYCKDSDENLRPTVDDYCKGLKKEIRDYHKDILSREIVGEDNFFAKARGGALKFQGYRVSLDEKLQKRLWVVGARKRDAAAKGFDVPLRHEISDCKDFVTRALVTNKLGEVYGIAPWEIRMGFGGLAYGSHPLELPEDCTHAGDESSTQKLLYLLGPVLVTDSFSACQNNPNPGSCMRGSYGAKFMDLREIGQEPKEDEGYRDLGDLLGDFFEVSEAEKSKLSESPSADAWVVAAYDAAKGLAEVQPFSKENNKIYDADESIRLKPKEWFAKILKQAFSAPKSSRNFYLSTTQDQWWKGKEFSSGEDTPLTHSLSEL